MSEDACPGMGVASILNAVVSSGRPAPGHGIMQAERVENPSHVLEEQARFFKPEVEDGTSFKLEQRP